MPIKYLTPKGGVFWGFGGGGRCQFYFNGRGDFSDGSGGKIGRKSRISRSMLGARLKNIAAFSRFQNIAAFAGR